MNFRRGRGREEPEINLIPMIDVLLVIIIFLMLTTTYARFSGLEINLPTADQSEQKEKPNEVSVAIAVDGRLQINRVAVVGQGVPAIAEAMKTASASMKDPIVVINADAKATHQSVIDVMQAAQMAGLPHISFATQSSSAGGAH